jgi:hypothetical protein
VSVLFWKAKNVDLSFRSWLTRRKRFILKLEVFTT